nr:retrovirus-related Pol polyprotein from transposon TNT 1-94 [Tanacetum cinerariifolium]
MATNEETSAAGSDTRPPMLVKSDYDSWKIRIHGYIRGKPHGKLIWKSIQDGPSPHPMITKAPGNVGNNGARGKKVICFNCRGEGHVSRQCKEPKRKMDSQYFKDKMTLIEAKEKGATLDTEAEAFLTNVECTTPYNEPLEMTTTNMFQASHEDAYDSDVDEGPNANVAFMANLTSKDVNELAQEMHQEEHLGFDDEYDFLTNTILYKKLSLVSDAKNVSTEASAATSNQIAMIDILNNLTSQVARHAKTNQEITLENNSSSNS